MPHISGDHQNPFRNISGNQAPGPAPVHPTSHSQARSLSPTLFELGSRAFVEYRTGEALGPKTPTGKVDMDPAQAAACHLFKNNLRAMDPSGRLRTQGEFTQAFARRGNSIHAMGPMHYARGTSLTRPGGIPGATFFIHSPASPASGSADNFPSNADFLIAYKRSQGNTNEMEGQMMYHHGEDKFYGYQGKVNPETRLPEFRELENPFDMGPSRPILRAVQTLPDENSWGHHFINWPPSPPR